MIDHQFSWLIIELQKPWSPTDQSFNRFIPLVVKHRFGTRQSLILINIINLLSFEGYIAGPSENFPHRFSVELSRIKFTTAAVLQRVVSRNVLTWKMFERSVRETNAHQCEWLFSWASGKLAWASGILYRVYKRNLFSGECSRNLVSYPEDIF